jgi:hypothetical protein
MAQPIWQTKSGSLGSFPAQIFLEYTFIATPVSPAVSVSYIFLSGDLPEGVTFQNTGVLSGTPATVDKDTIYTFSLRAIDNLGGLRDRTFSITISGAAIPQFTTPEGDLLSVLDSTWVELAIEYSNPNPDNPVYIEVKEGILPPGLEINELGILRGYPQAPLINISSPLVETATTITDNSNNTFTCISTTGFVVGRPIIFSGSVFGGISEGTTYYVKEILNSTTFTISSTQNGPIVILNSGTGFMTTTLPSVSSGSPTIQTYTFVLRLNSPLGNDTSEYSITIINQNTSVFSGGPGYLPNTRIPTILNTRPLTFNISKSDPENFGYYIVPAEPSQQFTVPLTSFADIGKKESNNYFAFRILGYDFDGSTLIYQFLNTPTFLSGDSQTGWIVGTPILDEEGIQEFNFSVRVIKSNNLAVVSPIFNFSLLVYKTVKGVITWITPKDLGTIFNGTISTLRVAAISDVDLQYEIINGSLPPNLSLLNNGEITGVVANQPTSVELPLGTNTEFSFEIRAFSPEFSVVTLSKEFTINVLQRYAQPTDKLYIKASPSIEDREILNSLLQNNELIPQEFLYRPDDIYFGKATSVIYAHSYNIYASDINQYLSAINENHYWRNITLGEIKTAIAKNNLGEVVYEVVYSEVVDNLVNPEGASIPKTIVWPRLIPLFLGPYWTSVVNIYVSWIEILGKEYYTSLSPGFAQILHPNSLYNMRVQVGDVLGEEPDSSLLPLWMTSQQENGSTLGYTQAWVICYTKPGFAKTIANNINNNWKDPIGRNYRLNEINFQIDRFTVDKSITYDIDRTEIDPPIWEYTDLPSATPTPNPIDSEDFYVLFPRETILPKD